jgi:hypothetical protein
MNRIDCRFSMKPTLTAVLLLLLSASAAMAGRPPLGRNITIPDPFMSGNGQGWYGGREDNETEPNSCRITGQSWDLEAMYLNEFLLTLVGGFDFKHGARLGSTSAQSGHLFIDVDGDVTPGRPTSTRPPADGRVRNTFGYDYVVTFDFNALTCSVYVIDQDTVISVCTDGATSMPWRYVSGGSPLPGYQARPIDYRSGLTSRDVGGLLGDGDNERHYTLRLNTGFLTSRRATFSFATEGGFDSLMGRMDPSDTLPDGLQLAAAQEGEETQTTPAPVSVPDAGGTLSLLGGVLVLLAAWNCRRSVAQA